MGDYSFTGGSGGTTNGAGQLTLDEVGAATTVTIETSGTYQFIVDGGHGGVGTLFAHLTGASAAGGAGASVTGDIFLTAGTQLEIVVGGGGGDGVHQHGAGISGGGGGGGGGGSFIFEINPTTHVLDPLAIAGGGGGGGESPGGLVGGPGMSGTLGADGGGPTNPGAGGAAGLAGAGAAHSGGGGGGGYTGGDGGGSGAGAAGQVLESSWAGGAGGSVVGLNGVGGGGGFGGGGGGGLTGGGGGGGYGGGGGGGINGTFAGGGGGGGGSFDLALNPGASETTGGASTVNAAEDNSGQIQITFESAACFATGSRIATTRGDVAVESLSVGDLAMTASGEARPIVWIGHRKVERPSPDEAPVRVTTGAFGEGRPRRDLFLSPGHAVCVDEVFVPVGQLVNGATIAQVEAAEVTYWHVELESHDVLLAEGLPCESYMDAGNRAWFGRQYGRLAEIDPDRVAESLTRYARPFVDSGPVVEAIRQQLATRAAALRWTRTADMDMHLMVDSERIEPRIDVKHAYFTFPATAKAARLVSRTFIPGADRRALGVRVEAVAITGGARIDLEVPLAEIAGFHPQEAASGCAWRWTDGNLPLPAALWAGGEGRIVLRLTFAPRAGHAWIAPPPQEALRAVA